MTSYQKLKAKYDVLWECINALEKETYDMGHIKVPVEKFDEFFEDLNKTEIFKHQANYYHEAVMQAIKLIWAIENQK